MRENLKQFIALRPGGCKGAITNADLYYLYNLVLNNRPNRVV